MAARSKRPELLAVVGPTASGKSDLGLALAQRFNGEIIAADSRTVYKGMDIGTAKPSKTDQSLVSHWGIDLVEPGQRYTAFQFKQYALAKIIDIKQRGGLPILVGGSGLYIDSVIYNYGFEARGVDDPANPRHRMPGSYIKDSKVVPGVLLIGLNPPSEELQRRISQRAVNMFRAGVVAEAAKLVNSYGEDAVKRTAGIVYKLCLKIVNGELTEEEAVDLFRTADWQYARRQRTWFKRNPDITWFSNKDEAEVFAAKLLSK